MRCLGLILLAILIVGLAIAGAGGAYLMMALDEPHPLPSDDVVFDYPAGSSTRTLAAELEDAGVIRSQYLFLAARAMRPDAKLQAGEYQFKGAPSIWDVYEKLAGGRVYLRPITIPEGLTRFETAELIAKAGYGTPEETLALTADPKPILDLFPQAKSLEGVLFPETYSFPRDATAADVVKAMVAGFRKAYDEASQGKTTPLAPYDVVTMASLVEKETGVPDERPLVSSVYHNRLRIGMLMQCDPTIIYGLILDGRYKGTLLEPDIRDPHEYNTYVHPGLPPGPIANPGKGALKAAFQPAETKLLYFVAEVYGQPQHVFSTSLTEHNRAVKAYRKTR
jgi:UPF0755 protein